MSKVISLKAENFKRLRAVDITPEPHLNVIAGRNAQGKTSVLDAITAALGGSSTKATPRPIRDGESSAEIVLETEDLIVTRTFTAAGTKVVVKGRDGATIGKGQAKLDSLLGRLSLDPLAFTQLSDRDQLKTLLDLVELPFDPAELDAERAQIFDMRTELNRSMRETAAKLAGHEVKPGDPTEEVSVTALLAEYRAAQELELAQTRDWQANAAMNSEINTINRQIQELMQRRSAIEVALDEVQDRIDNHAPLPDLEGIQNRIDGAEQTNRDARRNAEWLRMKENHDRAQGIADGWTVKLAGIDKRKADGLKAAKFPVDGLGFNAEGVTYNGVPFKQASGAEQLRVSLAMAIALNPALRVIRIADGSLLDNDSLDLVERMAIEHDYQVWIEMVSDSGDFGIVIEDGSVV
jgi:DNA repair exonuclease SbcCD ATPase subunit